MAIIVRCCCCNIRSGAIVTGIYTMVISLLNIGLYLYFTVIYKDMDDGYLKIPFTVYPTMVAASAVLFLLSLILLIAIKKDEHRAMMPWILFYILYLLFEGATVFILIFFYSVSALNIFALAWFVSRAVLGLYSLICVISQYQELGDGRGKSFDYRTETEYNDRPLSASSETRKVVVGGPNAFNTSGGFYVYDGNTGRNYSSKSTLQMSEDIELEERSSTPMRSPRRPRSPRIVPREVQTPNTYSNRYFEDDVF
ncbi:uncharacterized protein [Ptychodera flava]|uniref:uncharacterized protein n=1 Tax=Ptychodera flava TaxID=63121 RepID=UPI00396A3E20